MRRVADKAGIWQRVSSGDQDEASQLPDLIRWCDSHQYDVAETYVVHGKSAYTGKHAAALERVFTDMMDGKITVLVVWAADRIERRGALAALTLARRAKESGGRIEYVKDAHLNQASELDGFMLALAGDMARMESKRKSERVNAKLSSLRAAGSVTGRPPWGYEIEQRDGIKVFVPTDEARTYIPAIYEMMIEGKTLREIAAWLTSENVATRSGKPWHESMLGTHLIKNPVYYGRARSSGETEPLVPYSIWQAANAALTSRVLPGRGTVTHPKALLSPVCGNPNCDATGEHPSPMFRVFTGRKNQTRLYYRCTGKGPQRHGCGNMVRMSELDRRVTEAMTADHMNRHVERVFIAGDDLSDQIGRLRESGAEAMRKGDYATAMQDMQKATELEAQPRVEPHWETRETEQTQGDYFASLNTEGQREELTRWIVSAHRQSDGHINVTIMPRNL
jgi:DNA invertase Pin-like site-specific DNA recombinase